jgi:DNA-binding CsgD family transcriptional regulator
MSIMNMKNSDALRLIDSLTDRQLEAVKAMCDGINQVTMAERLNISLPTLVEHLQAAKRKTGALNNVALGVIYVKSKQGAVNRAISQAKSELGAALAQTIPSDDQIIIAHVRNAYAKLEAL